MSTSPNCYVPTALFRLYNGTDHLYTTSEDEKNKGYYQYDEGIAGYVFSTPVEGTVPLYRLYNGTDHLYTTSEDEKNKGHYQYDEGIAGYVFSTPVEGAVPLYRLYNGTDHLYTTSEDEKNKGYYQYDEGIAGYVFPTQILWTTPKPDSTVSPGSRNIVTYNINKDLENKLKLNAKTACNFWNKFVTPNRSIVVQLGLFTEESNTIARAGISFKDGIIHNIIDFNTKYLSKHLDNAQVSVVLMHEIGHTLGFGWGEWENLYDRSNGEFTKSSIEKLKALEAMRVETDFGPGTQYSHWDEARHGKELMTGLRGLDESSPVLPVTIDIMALLGHKVECRLGQQINLGETLHLFSQMVFSRQADVKLLNLDYSGDVQFKELVTSQ